MRFLYQLVLSIGLVVPISGCLLHPDQEEIPGTYVAEYEFGTDSLVLKSDGTYAQEIKVKGRAEPLRVTGTWKYDQSESRITFSDVYLIPNPYSDEWDETTATNRGFASYAVERYFFSRKLRFGPDEGHPFNKA
ncbi:MAG: hypothetical protein KF814_02595 [Nitrospiraceae bacterium]|nr:hypothetical protein [Nitrospiraceae bacterium]